MGRSQRICFCRVLQFVLFHFQIAANESDDQLLLLFTVGVIDECSHHEDCFCCLLGRDLQVFSQSFNRGALGGIYLFKGFHLLCEVLLLKCCNLAVGSVGAGITGDDRVFADRREVHIFVGDLSAHHSAVRSDNDCRKAGATKDLKVGLIVGGVLLV